MLHTLNWGFTVLVESEDRVLDPAMSSPYSLPPQANIPVALGTLILEAGVAMAIHSRKAFRIWRRQGSGRTLRPGKDTPLWNELRAQLCPHLLHYGDQANLGRVLDLPRQRVHAFITARTEMPDAERTLQLLAWLIAVRNNQRPL